MKLSDRVTMKVKRQIQELGLPINDPTWEKVFRFYLDEKMMYNTFNMGIGLVVAVAADEADKAIECFKAAGYTAYVIGNITDGEKGVTLC